MPFDVLETLSLAGDTFKPNEDAFGHEPHAAVVLDGATALGDPLMPGDSDPAWLSHFGARRLMAHVRDGDAPRDALRHTLTDAEKSFAALRKRPPTEQWEVPIASMAFVFQGAGGFDFLWFGDCAGLLRRARNEVEVLGESFAHKANEARRAAKAAKELKLSPVDSAGRAPFLPGLRKSRNRSNSGDHWAFGPDPRAADHVALKHVAAPTGALLLLASDGFLALATDYGAYTAHTLMDAVVDRGLDALGEELRAIEEADPNGHKHPRFKKSDDATAVLLKLV
jgi:Protein phosphatase 2C